MQTATIQTNKIFSSDTHTAEQPKRLSKTGQWMQDHPNGIFIIKDRRAVNK